MGTWAISAISREKEQEHLKKKFSRYSKGQVRSHERFRVMVGKRRYLVRAAAWSLGEGEP